MASQDVIKLKIKLPVGITVGSRKEIVIKLPPKDLSLTWMDLFKKSKLDKKFKKLLEKDRRKYNIVDNRNAEWILSDKVKSFILSFSRSMKEYKASLVVKI
ncbi:unnamed protein product [Orchesella dallaii]|uniref:Uncharacterized protein n=1 Tax=Orchesella dallaii TaxID=48710 RepID=A0ABP1PU78_9HEXA